MTNRCASDVEEYTKQRNWKPPPIKLIVEWIIDAQNKLSGDVIEKLFKGCALHCNVNGPEGSCIYCFTQD